MKRVFTVLLVLAMAFGMMGTVFAAETEFVPSINEKPAPEFVEDDDGNVGRIVDSEGNVIGMIPADHLTIVPVSEAATSEELTEEQRATLLSVYEQLSNGTMTLPAEKLADNLSPEELVVRDLFELSWNCTEPSPTHEELVAPEGVTLQVTFKLNVADDANLFAMTYKNGEWNPIVSLTNNGDGTVTCEFEHLCPVAFIYGEDMDVPSTGFAFNSEMMLWMGVMMVSAVALVGVVVIRRKKEQA